ncbi:MAG: hypothetical protein A2136_06150 [Chloroflexi bacterium RBG_16_54_11]|nr:MAG: hypothetical protein A2136_06150 [Chloroflexi bacterium RBG_16_54_11]
MRIRWLTQLLLLLYLLLISYNLVALTIGLPYHPVLTPIFTVVAFTIALLHGSQTLGWRHTLLLLALPFAVSLLFESVCVATGWVYGAYHYTDKLGPKFLGLVPLLIPLGWFMMTYPSYVIASHLVSPFRRVWVWRVAVAAVGALVMTAWDLAMDPMMVGGGHWVWDQPGGYFGIPLQNYWGWWLTTFVTFGLFLWLVRRHAEPASSTDPFTRLATWSYAITGLSSILVDFIFHLDGPALVGLFAMLPWVVVGIKNEPRTNADERR